VNCQQLYKTTQATPRQAKDETTTAESRANWLAGWLGGWSALCSEYGGKLSRNLLYPVHLPNDNCLTVNSKGLLSTIQHSIKLVTIFQLHFFVIFLTKMFFRDQIWRANITKRRDA
jgi:hypothetical protein